MLYTEYMNKVCELSILYDEVTGQHYVDPWYRSTIRNSEIGHVVPSDFAPTDEEICEHIELETKRRNMFTNTMPLVSNWIFDVISSAANPISEAESNEMAKDLLEYMKLKQQLEDKKKEEKKANVTQMYTKRVIE